MNRTKINAAMCGATLGKKILMVLRNPVDPNYSDDKKNDILRLSRPIFLYSIKPVLLLDKEKQIVLCKCDEELFLMLNFCFLIL